LKDSSNRARIRDVKERTARLEAARKLIKKEKIKSQDTLLALLQNEGFPLTQATLSRDLRELKVGKVSDGRGAYVYTLPSDEERRKAERACIQDFLKGYVSVDWSGNVVLVKTYSGHSDPVALAVDSLNFDEVLGTVAGRDNAVAVFLREGVSGEDFMKRLRETIPELEE
jgi:transcriptional regulator of arginine metabolism